MASIWRRRKSPQRSDLRGLRPAIPSLCVQRVAEHGVGDEDVLAPQSRDRQQRLETPAGLVAVEGHAAAPCPESPRRLPDKQHPRARRAVRRAQRVAVRHARAGEARLHLLQQRREGRGCHAAMLTALSDGSGGGAYARRDGMIQRLERRIASLHPAAAAGPVHGRHRRDRPVHATARHLRGGVRARLQLDDRLRRAAHGAARAGD